MIFLMNCFILPLLFLWTILGIVLTPIGFFFMKIVLGYSTSFIIRKCIWIYGRVWQVIICPFVFCDPLEMHGEPFKNPGIIVVNHRSFFDTFCMNMMPISDVCFAVRDWPFKMPVFNLFMKLAGYINIEKFSWDKTLEVSQNNFQNKSFVLFFPEGHRSHDKKMMRFYSGAFKLAIENSVPVIPICLTGTQDLLPPKRYYLKPARIKMKILDPILPDQFTGELKHVQFNKCVKKIMEDTVKQMDELTQ
jgi:1-acyl-sn-glycerol-3-phosphate acyltransferase